MKVDLLAFGETWLPGYTLFHATSCLPEGRVRYLENAVEIPSPTTERLCEAAHEAKTDVAIAQGAAYRSNGLDRQGDESGI
jgi:predicted amidohydrolase